MLFYIFFLILSIGLLFLLFSKLLSILFKPKKSVATRSIFIVSVLASLLIVLQGLPLVKKMRDKLLTYEVVVIKIHFDKKLNENEIETNLDSIIKHFRGHERQYSELKTADTSHIKSSKTGNYGSPSVTIAKSEKMPFYWKQEGNSLTIFISSRLSNKQVSILKTKLNQRFFDKHQLPTSIEVESVTKSLFLSMLLNHLDIVYDKTLEIEPDFIAHGIIKHGQDEFAERKAACSMSFKIKGDYWQPLFTKAKKSNLSIAVMMGMKKTSSEQAVKRKFYAQLSQATLQVKFAGKEYKAFIFFDSNMTLYLSLLLESYVEQYVDKNEDKPYIKMKQPYTVMGQAPLDIYADVKKDCLQKQIKKYPYLEKIFVERNFLQTFKGNPINISVNKQHFSPLYNDVNIIE